MKKTYTAPVLLISGDVIRETLAGRIEGDEPQGNTVFMPSLVGGLGYYL
jgi:hypothetical protein